MLMQEIAWRWIHRDFLCPTVGVQACLSKLADSKHLWVFPSALLCMLALLRDACPLSNTTHPSPDTSTYLIFESNPN